MCPIRYGMSDSLLDLVQEFAVPLRQTSRSNRPIRLKRYVFQETIRYGIAKALDCFDKVLPDLRRAE